jgi:hypothetical protein
MLLVFLVFEHLLVFFFLLQCSSSSMGLPTSQTVTEREREREYGVAWCGVFVEVTWRRREDEPIRSEQQVVGMGETLGGVGCAGTGMRGGGGRTQAVGVGGFEAVGVCQPVRPDDVKVSDVVRA